MESLDTASRFDECEENVSSDGGDVLVSSDDSEVLIPRVEGEDHEPCSQYAFADFILLYRVLLVFARYQNFWVCRNLNIGSNIRRTKMIILPHCLIQYKY